MIDADGPAERLPTIPGPERAQELLFAAARMGRDELIPGLLSIGAKLEDFSADGYTALILATYNGQKSTTMLLIELGADVDGTDELRGNTALMGVCFKGHLDIVRALIDAGADVNKRSLAGQTALMTAARFGRVDVVELLVEAGADPCIVDNNGASAVTLARAQGHWSLLKLLHAHAVEMTDRPSIEQAGDASSESDSTAERQGSSRD